MTNHSGRPVGRMDAPADKRRNDVAGPRPSFARESGPAADDWRKRAACLPWRLKARGIAPRVFFPASFVSPEGKAEAELAKSVCADYCTVRAECLRHAFDSGCGDGVFGGFTPDERRALKRQAQRARARERGEQAPDESDIERESAQESVKRVGRDRRARDARGAFVSDAASVKA